MSVVVTKSWMKNILQNQNIIQHNSPGEISSQKKNLESNYSEESVNGLQDKYEDDKKYGSYEKLYEKNFLLKISEEKNSD
jgi:hypothetical protein